ncbi:MAG: signal peptidase I [Verrucomicrobia bacterium]|nr:MAG: signal peptidase I [Verrucomicrobiota bacterium]
MESNSQAGCCAGAVGGVVLIVELALIVLIIAAMWRIFTKAGQPGWAALIPIYNVYVMLQVAGKPGWWLILFFIPIVNLVIAIITVAALGAKFGKGVGFVIGLILLPIVFYPMLGFGRAQYNAAPALPPT